MHARPLQVVATNLVALFVLERRTRRRRPQRIGPWETRNVTNGRGRRTAHHGAPSEWRAAMKGTDGSGTAKLVGPTHEVVGHELIRTTHHHVHGLLVEGVIPTHHHVHGLRGHHAHATTRRTPRRRSHGRQPAAATCQRRLRCHHGIFRAQQTLCQGRVDHLGRTAAAAAAAAKRRSTRAGGSVVGARLVPMATMPVCMVSRKVRTSRRRGHASSRPFWGRGSRRRRRRGRGRRG